VQLSATAGTGSAMTTSVPEQLRETLGKSTRTDLVEMCKAAGIGGCSSKRKDELIDLLVRKKPRLDEQVGALRKDRAPPVCAALGSAVCAL
jgi:hypothetical protein